MKKIYLIAPSFGIASSPYFERYEIAKKYLKEKGFEIKEGKNIFKKKDELVSASKEERIEELYEAYQSDADFVISVGGGELEIELLLELDLEKIKKEKIFIGYSDNTNLNFVLTLFKETQNIIGFNFPKFYLSTKERDDLLRLMNNEQVFASYDYKEDRNQVLSPTETPNYNIKTSIKVINYQESYETYFCGGTLDCLIHLIGTKYDRFKEYTSQKPTTLLLEACDINATEFKRCLIHLKLAGWLDNLKGIIIGRHNIEDTEYGYTKDDHLKEILTPLKIPIIYNADFGHTNPQMPFITNRKAKVSIENNRLIVTYLN